MSASLLMVLFCTTTFAQKGDYASDKCVQKGTILVDAFYGLPYINGALIKAAYSSDSLSNATGAHNYNHLGAKVEYMVTNKLGLGIEATYANATVDYINNSNLQHYTAGMRKTRILAKMNYHFATGTHIDPYITWGVGYKDTQIYTNEPGTVRSVSVNLLPIAVRTGIGVRYFFTDIIGINAEVGLGGPLVQGGLSLKF